MLKLLLKVSRMQDFHVVRLANDSVPYLFGYPDQFKLHCKGPPSSAALIIRVLVCRRCMHYSPTANTAKTQNGNPKRKEWATMKVGRGSFHMRGCSIVGNFT